MKTKIILFPTALVLVVVGISLLASDRSTTLSQRDDGDRRLETLAGALKLDVGRINNRGVVRNMVGIKSDYVLFSQRRDSRTYFIQDNRYGPSNPAGVYQGTDDTVLERSRSILRTLEIPADEISKTNVLREKNQTAHRDIRTRRLVIDKPGDGKVFGEFWRQVSGVPVFSSRALIGLTKEGSVGYMEVHWPEIPRQTVEEARRLQGLVRGRWQPPAQKGATVESVEAGIIHSPALGFVMDVYPVIRVIYKPVDGRIGRKPVLYLDGNGRNVPVPRQFEKVEETPNQKRYKK